nr:PREDICTED: zinc finger protein 704-like [Equus przewalskii]
MELGVLYIFETGLDLRPPGNNVINPTKTSGVPDVDTNKRPWDGLADSLDRRKPSQSILKHPRALPQRFPLFPNPAIILDDIGDHPIHSLTVCDPVIYSAFILCSYSHTLGPALFQNSPYTESPPRRFPTFSSPETPSHSPQRNVSASEEGVKAETASKKHHPLPKPHTDQCACTQAVFVLLAPCPSLFSRKSSEELDMDKVTAAMVLTSLSTSPLVRSPPVRPNGTEGLSGSWKEGGAGPSSSSSSGYWSWSAPSDQSNPSTPSPPLSADSFKPFRSLLFDEPIPRKRKNSMKVMFKCLWKNCGKVLGTAAGIQKHIRTIHLGRVGDSDYSDGEEDFYYTEIKLNTDSVADGLSSLAPVSPSQSLASPPTFPIPESSRTETPCAKTETKLMTPLSRSAPTTLYLVHTDHAYQATPPVTIPGSAEFTPNGSSFSISWQSPPVTFTGIPVSPTHSHPAGPGEQRQHTHTVLSSPPRGTVSLRKPRGEGKKCRKVYGMENRDLWCTACRWKKACQRFID